MEIAAILFVVVLATGLLYFAIARLLANRPAYPAEIEAFGREHNRLVDDLKAERGLTKSLNSEVGRLAARVDSLERELAAKEQRWLKAEEALQTNVATLRKDLHIRTEDLSQATAQLEHAARANAEMKHFLADAQSRLSAVFTEMAGKVFDERTRVLEHHLRFNIEKSRADIEGLLQPYGERLGEFRQRLDVVHHEETQDRSSLLGAVKELKNLNQRVADQAAALTSVLRGSSKVRSDWGSLMLDKVLSSSGLVEGQHYLKNTSDENESRPDVVITLPDDRKIVIDCSFSLTVWQQAMNADTTPLQQEALLEHAKTLKQHIVALSRRNYPKQIGETALEISVAFVPIEAALSAALGTEPGLQADAFAHKVALASPNTLIALLAVVERLWTRDQVRLQAAEISAAGDKVLNALTPLLQVFEKTGNQLGLAHESFIEAQRLLTESSQALIPEARRLAALGKGDRETAGE